MDDPEAKCSAWTIETPKKTGFYWLYTGDDEDLEIVKVVQGEDNIVVYPPSPQEPYEIEHSSVFDDRTWYGPLEPPP
jgi:hypothetical protein